MAKDTRCRVWTFLVYPESAPENWRDLLDEEHIEYVVSPLHDRDINPTGEPKKAHWHLMLSFEGKKSFDQIKEFTDLVNGTIPQRVNNQRSMIRYFAHIDNPEKVQYNITDIETHGGIDVCDLLRPGGAARTLIIRDIIKYIQEHNVTEYCDLIDDLENQDNDEWLDVVLNYATYTIEKYIKSNRNRYYAQLKADRDKVLQM